MATVTDGLCSDPSLILMDLCSHGILSNAWFLLESAEPMLHMCNQTLHCLWSTDAPDWIYLAGLYQLKSIWHKPEVSGIKPNHRQSADPSAIGRWICLYPTDGSASADGEKIHHRLNTVADTAAASVRPQLERHVLRFQRASSQGASR